MDLSVRIKGNKMKNLLLIIAIIIFFAACKKSDQIDKRYACTELTSVTKTYSFGIHGSLYETWVNNDNSTFDPPLDMVINNSNIIAKGIYNGKMIEIQIDLSDTVVTRWQEFTDNNLSKDYLHDAPHTTFATKDILAYFELITDYDDNYLFRIHREWWRLEYHVEYDASDSTYILDDQSFTCSLKID